MVRARTPFLFSFVLVVLFTNPSFAQTSEADRLKAELEALRLEFSNRIAELEARLKAVENAAAQPAPAPVEAPPPALPTQMSAAPSSSSKMFNPDVAAIGDFIGAVGKSPGGGEPSLQLHEAELSLQAVVDPYARADVYLTFGPDEVGIEEAFVTFPTLPGGLLMKVGKFRDAFGKINAAHNHVLPFTERPLMTQNLLGGEEGLGDSGVSVSRIFPNNFAFIEATGQVFQGNSEIFKAEKRADLAYVGHLRGYRDLTESTNIDLGGSFAQGHNDAGGGDTTRLWGADATFRYRPLRRSIYTHFLARTEVAWSRRSELSGPSAFGAYGYLEYQFARRWTSGLRLDTAERATDPSIRDRGASFLLTYAPSEFSLVRGQYRHTRRGDGPRSNEFLFQFLFSIGAHGAHPF
ncbi:MAG: hypothetical protein K1Y01_13645 [Vicinamibacteria bacterium]|nr:hypothetical protein [Vicinamibacteria bacterium]